MTPDARIPANFPILADQPIWILLVIFLIGMIAMWKLNNAYFGWFHRNYPGLLRPKTLLAIIALSIAVIAIGLIVNPPAQFQTMQSQQK
jgi:hypothetical protein